MDWEITHQSVHPPTRPGEDGQVDGEERVENENEDLCWKGRETVGHLDGAGRGEEIYSANTYGKTLWE